VRRQDMISTGFAVMCVMVVCAPVAFAVDTQHRVLRHVGDHKAAIVGRLLFGGGPLGADKLGSFPAPHFRVIVKEATKAAVPNIAGGKTVTTTFTKKDGSFYLAVRPGRYVIAGEWAFGKTCFSEFVTVHSHKRTHVRLECSRR
jgi:hypothetical protein